MKNFYYQLPYTCFAIFLHLVCVYSSNAQPLVEAKFGKGITVVAADSSFAMRFGARFQTLYSGSLNTGDGSYDDAMLIRRARLKFSGFVYNPKLKYKIELGMSNRDIGVQPLRQNSYANNIIYDAVLVWDFHKNFSLWLGQTKLPGNRERVISSQSLQFVDRSAVNAYFNLDRDIGFQLRHKFKINNIVFREILAVSMGEGRGVTVSNTGGYDYTLRGEILPFGEFTGDGDYFSSDLLREEKPKLSVGVTYDLNKGASREGGQLGNYLPVNRDLSTVFVDAIFKYQGHSMLMEYANKTAPDGHLVSLLDEGNNPVTYTFDTGNGFNIQYGYLLRNNLELSARYTQVDPEGEATINRFEEYTIGVSKYIVGHSLKIQSDVSLITEAPLDDEIRFRLQVEMAL